MVSVKNAADKQKSQFGITIASPEEGYALQSEEISITTSTGNVAVFKRQNEQGLIHAIYLEMSSAAAAIRLSLDGREITNKDYSIADLRARGMDTVHPILPYAPGPNTPTIHVWMWTPALDRLSQYYESIEITIAAGVTITGRAIYSKKVDE